MSEPQFPTWWLLLFWCTTSLRVQPTALAFHAGAKHTVFTCHLNSLCHCISYPNETRTHDLACHDASLYKFPGI